MKKYFYLLNLFFLLAANGKGQNYLTRTDGDEALFDAVEKLNKKPTNGKATKALPTLYANAQKRHLDIVAAYAQGNGLARWQHITSSYGVLQDMYTAIRNTAAAAKLVQPTDYQNELDRARQAAAAENYEQAQAVMATGKRTDAIKAYRYFKAAVGFVPDYKDAAERMEKAYDVGCLKVVINEFVVHPSVAATLNNNSPSVFEGLQQKLAKELGDKLVAETPIKLFTGDAIKSNGVVPDWSVDVALLDFSITNTNPSQHSYDKSEPYIEFYDTSHKPVYGYAKARITVHKQSQLANATMVVSITDAANPQKPIMQQLHPSYQWYNEYLTYYGDDRALSANEMKRASQGGDLTPPSANSMLSSLAHEFYTELKGHVLKTLRQQLE
jgi:hypothetical protein